MDENEILLSDILNFIKAVALREFRASGPQHYQHFEDILTLLKELEAKEADQHSNAHFWLGYIEVNIFLVCHNFLSAYNANNMDPDQTASKGAV